MFESMYIKKILLEELGQARKEIDKINDIKTMKWNMLKAIWKS